MEESSRLIYVDENETDDVNEGEDDLGKLLFKPGKNTRSREEFPEETFWAEKCAVVANCAQFTGDCGPNLNTHEGRYHALVKETGAFNSYIPNSNSVSMVTIDSQTQFSDDRSLLLEEFEKNKDTAMLIQNDSSSTINIACGITCIAVIGVIGVGLMVLAEQFNVKDLYIVGGMFTLGGLAFTAVFLLGQFSTRCYT